MGFDTANPLGGLNTDISFTPGGNPYSALATGGLAGLGTAYGQTYNSALNASQQQYNAVVGGYKNLASGVMGILGQGGGWGVAAPAAQAIQDTLAQAKGGAIQNSINKGLGSSTAAVAAQRGANLDANKAYASLGSQLAQTAAGYTSGLGQGMLGAIQGLNIQYPNAGEYSGLYQQYGQQQQSAMNMAMLAQQQAAQQQLAMRAMSASQSRGGGGGVSTPQMPRGGTYGSGGGSFASGGGLTPSGFGVPMNGMGGSSGSATGGGYNMGAMPYSPPQSINPSAGYGDPFGSDIFGGDQYGGMIGGGAGDFGGGGAF